MKGIITLNGIFAKNCDESDGKTFLWPFQQFGLVIFIAFSLYCLLLVGTSTSSAFAAGNPADVTVDEFPKSLQLYPRDPISNTAEVVISGTVANGSDYTAIKVLVERQGTYFADPNMVLDYSNGDAQFFFSVSIMAELANYDFMLIATDSGGDTEIVAVEDVVAGDVYLLNGQSNANARKRTGSNFVGINAGNYYYIRSFGRRETCFPGPACGTTSIDPFNTDWYIANGDNDAGKGAIGQWGVLLARKIIDDSGIPVAFLSNAVSNTSINKHQSGYSNYTNIYSAQIPHNNIYQRLLWRAQKAGVAEHVRAMIWHQGESDSGNSVGHESGFKSLYTDWMQDYPNLEQVYAHQIRNIVAGCGNGADILVREVQRRMIDDPFYSNLQVMSTTAIDAQIEDCHYPHASTTALDAQGEIAQHVFNLMARDFYDSTNIQNIDAPNINFAYFTDATKQTVNMVMRDLDDTLQFAAGAEQDFQIESATSSVVAGSSTGNIVSVTLDSSAAGASGISYVGHTGVELKNEPQSNWTTAEPRWGQWVTNANGVGLLAFYDVPIAEDLPTINITDPLNGSVVDLGQPITLQYTAADVDGLKEVNLYANSQLITSTMWSSSPISVTDSIIWSPSAAGIYTFTATVADVKNAHSSATAVAIEVNTPPTISIVTPLSGAVFPSGSNVPIQTNPQDIDGSIVGTSLYANSALLTNTVTSAPWEFIWMNAPSGTYSVTATSVDDDGSTSAPSGITIRVNQAPTITLLSPLTGTVFIQGTTAPLIGAAPMDPDGTIASVEFYDNATLLTTLTTAPWTYDWASAPAGQHMLTAKTIDNDGDIAVSDPVNIDVVIPTPTPTDTPTPLPTDTPTPIPPTPTLTPTDTPTPTQVPTETPTPVPPTPTETPTPTPTPIDTPMNTAVSTTAATPLPSTGTPTSPVSPTVVISATITGTPMPNATMTPVAGATITPTVAVSTPTAGPALTLSGPTISGAPGSNFVVEGSGFASNASLELLLNGQTIGTYDTNNSGGMVVVIKTLPQIALGAYSVTVSEIPGISTAFVVDATAAVRTPVAAGAEVTIPLVKSSENLLFLPLVSQ